MTEKEHGRYQELVHEALDGTLDPRDREELDGHLQGCDECAALLRTIGTAAEAWKDQPHEVLDPASRDEIGDGIMAAIGGEATSGADGRGPRTRSVLTVAAGLAVAAAAALALAISWPESGGDEGASMDEGVSFAGGDRRPVIVGDESPTAGVEAPADDEIVAAVVTSCAGKAVVSSDGTKPEPVHVERAILNGESVALDADAEISMEVPLVADLRLRQGAIMEIGRKGGGVELDLRRGVLACRVSKREPGRELTVMTPAGTVEVRGTVFEVEVLATSQVSVSVAEGKVVVRDAADDRNVVAVGARERMAFDWSAPRPVPLEGEKSDRLLALFGLARPHRGGAERQEASHKRREAGGSDWEALFEEALEKRGAGDLDGAVSIYERIAAGGGNAHKAEAIFALGQIGYQRGDYPASVEQLRSGAELFAGTPYETMALFYEAKGSYKLGRCDDAAAAARRFLEISPSHRLAENVKSLTNQCSSR